MRTTRTVASRRDPNDMQLLSSSTPAHAALRPASSAHRSQPLGRPSWSVAASRHGKMLEWR
ncbi:hypothetical protein DEI92_10185 [Curtobacterium sp. MCBD17_034]|nr:hypothetical protein DEI92_10185 [Curtobacterium sp. MCBD17_034]PZM34436.1 hypothetical protein DEI90_06755 [Curtobacterium sp. MCBD17_031]